MRTTGSLRCICNEPDARVEFLAVGLQQTIRHRHVSGVSGFRVHEAEISDHSCLARVHLLRAQCLNEVQIVAACGYPAERRKRILRAEKIAEHDRDAATSPRSSRRIDRALQ